MGDVGAGVSPHLIAGFSDVISPARNHTETTPHLFHPEIPSPKSCCRVCVIHLSRLQNIRLWIATYIYRWIQQRRRSETAEHLEATRPHFNSLIIATSARGRSRGLASVLTLSTTSLSALSPRPRLGIPRNTIPSKLHDLFELMPHNAPQKRNPPGMTAPFHAISTLGTNDGRRHRSEPRHYGCQTAHIHGAGNQPGPRYHADLLSHLRLPTRW